MEAQTTDRTETELVIRIYSVTQEQRNQFSDYLIQESERQGLYVKTDASDEVLGDLNYETILVTCTIVQTGVEVVKTIHSILEPWLAEQRAARKSSAAKEQEIKAEIVREGTVVNSDEEAKADKATD